MIADQRVFDDPRTQALLRFVDAVDRRRFQPCFFRAVRGTSRRRLVHRPPVSAGDRCATERHRSARNGGRLRNCTQAPCVGRRSMRHGKTPKSTEGRQVEEFVQHRLPFSNFRRPESRLSSVDLPCFPWLRCMAALAPKLAYMHADCESSRANFAALPKRAPVVLLAFTGAPNGEKSIATRFPFPRNLE
jgi:hypothetical protein